MGQSTGMKFLEGAPVFAVEVRSEGAPCVAALLCPLAEQAIADKREDYFAAGTLVVWDLDLLGPEVITVYRAADPENPTVYRRGEVAEAEPAVPGWRIPVDDLFG
jgi:Uma2 family endonuclease